MSSAPVAQRQGFQLGAKHVFWTIIVLMFVYVLHHNERFLIDHADPYWQHIAAFKWWLLVHGVSGACALLIGPFQFTQKFRERHLKAHRVMGRIYVGGTLIVGPIGTYIQYRDQLTGSASSFTYAAFTFAGLWMLSTIVALGFAMKRKIQQHRQWMTRSYAYCLIFLEVRVIIGLAGWDNNERVIEVVVWMLVAAAPIVAEFVLQWQELRSKRVLAYKAAAAD